MKSLSSNTWSEVDIRKLPILLLLCLGGLFSCESPQQHTRVQDFNLEWQFALQDPDKELGSLSWRTLNLPHDWSVEASFDSVNGEGATGYLPGGTGWYQKEFQLDLADDEEAYIFFDGVYNNATFWINDKELGFHPYGYSPFHYNLTPHLNGDGKTNVLKVKVDRTRYADSRWYTGSGIYRNVQLIRVNRLHIPIWGTFVTTPQVSEQQASVQVEIQVKNDYGQKQAFVLEHQVFDPRGNLIQTVKEELEQDQNTLSSYLQTLTIQNPALWNLDTPALYTLRSSVLLNGQQVDEYTTSFGIRSIRFDPETGFFLNGKNTAIKGVCLHHDAGLVGAAVPDGVWRRRLEKLKEGGCNAIRISHNPGSAAFLQLCDELGFLVQDEFFDEWDNPKDKRLNMNERSVDAITRGYTEYFQEWAETDLKNTMLAHRNHPSIIQWSIGNEIEWTYPRNAAATGFFDADWSGNYFWSTPPYQPDEIKQRYESTELGPYQIEKTAAKLAAWTRELDTTRPVVANCILPSASFETGYADVLDVVGFSYRRVMYDYARTHYPDKVVMGTENLGQWHEWKAVQERSFISGTFLWTGIDYMGEANQGWPRKGVGSGLLDLAGFEKPAFYMMQSLWSDDPSIGIFTQSAAKSIYRLDEGSGAVVEKKPGAWKQALWGWHALNEHWNYEAGERVIVEVISACQNLELFLNGESLGQKKLSDFEDRIYKWAVPFAPGKLEVKGTVGGKEVQASIQTHATPVAISVSTDQVQLKADGYEVAHLEVQLQDERGNPVKSKDRIVEFDLEGPAYLLGVDNGAIDNVQDFQSNQLKTHQGRALAIIQSTRQPGVISVRVFGEGLQEKVLEINSK